MTRKSAVQTTRNPMPGLLRRLADAGISRGYVRKIALPEWWDDKIAATQAGYAQTLAILSRNLGLDFKSLQDENADIRFSDFGTPKFKLAKGVNREEVAQARALASCAAHAACVSIRNPLCALPTTGAGIRRSILDQGAHSVGLENLLDWCWRMGVPVLHVAEFPKSPSQKKMDGLAARFKGCPAIVLCSAHRHPAWLLFHLAHELGHVVLGHLPAEGVLVDENVSSPGSEEAEEAEANPFANELLSGTPDLEFASPRLLTGERLASVAATTGRRLQIDPGFVILNYAWNSGGKQWGAANKALNSLDAAADGPGLIHRKMTQNLDLDKLPEESGEWLLRITGAKDAQ